MAPTLEIDRHTLRKIGLAFVLLASLTIHRLWFAEDPDAPAYLVLSGRNHGNDLRSADRRQRTH